jgi:diguanylate cyclase (GGDEF)-like protein
VRILIAEDDAVSSHLLATTLTNWGHDVVVTGNGLEAWHALQKPDAPLLAILDWMMPEMDGLELCRKVRQEITSAPIYIILLTALSRKENLIEGMKAGADDYLTKPFDRQELKVRLQAGARIVELQRSLGARIEELQGAIVERQRAEDALRNLTLTDDLTGLYNHRGFFTLAEHHAKIARRTGKTSLLIYADMDGLKEINDAFGHSEGSLAIAQTALILRKTFRDSDIIARLGGDEFAILSPDVSENQGEKILERLRNNLDLHNLECANDYPLSLSTGAIYIDRSNASSIEELVALADRAMYENKRKKGNTTPILSEPTPTSKRLKRSSVALRAQPRVVTR